MLKKLKSKCSICFFIMTLFMTACGKDNTTTENNSYNDVEKVGYYYSVLNDYTKNSDGKLNKSNGTYISYFDYESKTSVPLCSNINCNHYNHGCNSYFDENQCLGGMFYDYNGRIYMIERTDQKDVLVSYDKYGQNKNNELELSSEKQYVGYNGAFKKSMSRLFKDKLFFVRYNNDDKGSIVNLTICYVDMQKKDKVNEVGEIQVFKNQRGEIVKFIENSNNIYLLTQQSQTSNTTDRKRECYKINIGEHKLENIIKCSSTEFSSIVKGDTYYWLDETIIDDDENLYFSSWEFTREISNVSSDGEYVLNKFNTSNSTNQIIYVLNHNNNVVGPSGLKLKGMDSQYIYLDFKYNSNSENQSEISVIENGNGIKIIDKQGNEVKTICFSVNYERDLNYSQVSRHDY
ncbi:MAG: hypothetical protein Q4F06_01535 [Eubacteriales bacterium]|nr:hypothetical protein [Eubacteriales bacterium]